jgi:RNA-directed DNA polymerase
MDRLAKRIDDKAVLRLIRRYLEAGILSQGVAMQRYEGTPKGGPLSAVLANVLLGAPGPSLCSQRRRLKRLRSQSQSRPTRACRTAQAVCPVTFEDQ